MLRKKEIKNLSCLIIGAGSIGRRHANNLKNIGIKKISIYDKEKTKVKEASRILKVKKHDDLDNAVLSNPDFCVICTYPSSHIEIAKKCIKNDSHIFIEKPLSSNLNGIESLLQQAKKKNLKIGVGYNLRFDIGLNAIKKKLTKRPIGKILSISSQWGHHIKYWRPGLNYKDHYVLKKGNGIILDDSHEYDYLRWLLNDEVKSVYCQTMKASSIKTQTESIAIIVLKFKKGAMANLLIDYIRPTYERFCQIIGEKGSIKWQTNPINSSSWKNYQTKSVSTVTTTTLGKKPKSEIFKFKTNHSYVSELENFIDSFLSDHEPFVSGSDALKTLKVGLAALESANKNKVIRL